MLYFEDFMEDIEGIDIEFKQNLTAIRQLDLQVQNIMDPLEGRISDFFNRCSQNTFAHVQQQQEYEKILNDFDNIEGKNGDKIKITEQMKDTFNKMIKKLDIELAKFKLELEADSPGSAEILERAVNQKMKSGLSDSVQRIERKRIKRGRLGIDFTKNTQNSEKNDYGSGVIVNSDSQNDALMTTAVANGSLSPASSFMGSLNTPHSNKRKFEWKSASSSHMDRSIKSEKRKHKYNSITSEDSLTNEDLGIDEVSTAEIDVGSRRQNDGMSDAGSGRTPGSLTFGMSYGGESLVIPQISADSQMNLESDVLELEHNDEPRYCYCNDVSYGDMIACDAPNCPREWFHYGCVNLVVAPKGSWFCKECKVKLRQQRK